MFLSVVIPAYSEADNLNILLPAVSEILGAVCDRFEIIVSDSPKSEDNTKEVCEKYGCIHSFQQGRGYSDAIRNGFNLVHGDRILVLDADLSQDINALPEMISAAKKGADVVIGSRYVSGGKTADPATSVIMSAMLNLAFRVLLGFKEKDISTDFRIYRTDMIKEIKTESENLEIIEEILFLLKKKNPGLKVVEIPVDYKRRKYGSSKRNLLPFISSYLVLLRRLVRYE